MNAPWARWVGAAIAAAWVAVCVCTTPPRAPLSAAGMRLASPHPSVPIPTRDVTFLDDITGADAYGHGFSSHTLFDAMLRSIADARSLIVLDCHLCNDLHRTSAPDAVVNLTPMAAQLIDALLARKAAVPQLQVLVIADPVNDLYGSAAAPANWRLADAARRRHPSVVTADLSRPAGSQCPVLKPVAADAEVVGTGRERRRLAAQSLQ